MWGMDFAFKSEEIFEVVLSSALTGGASVVVAIIDEELQGNEIYRKVFSQLGIP